MNTAILRTVYRIRSRLPVETEIRIITPLIHTSIHPYIQPGSRSPFNSHFPSFTLWRLLLSTRLSPVFSLRLRYATAPSRFVQPTRPKPAARQKIACLALSTTSTTFYKLAHNHGIIVFYIPLHYIDSQLRAIVSHSSIQHSNSVIRGNSDYRLDYTDDVTQ